MSCCSSTYSFSLSFLNSTCSFPNHRRLFTQIGFQNPSLPHPPPLTVQAKAKTRQENRIARHSRIRKKVRFVRGNRFHLLILLALQHHLILFLRPLNTVVNICTIFLILLFFNIVICFQVEGTPERPRLCVFRSNKHLYVQVIDDTKMHTLASASTMQKPISEEFDYSSGPTIVSQEMNFSTFYATVFLIGAYGFTSNSNNVA